uniref:ABC transporter permease n=1 Tax=Thaumasiovibrio occultus TaxID=1891184 RepID=UPI000B363038|nr:ABC transporter permease subunit [Thaumasiovibrio occultus]
MRLNPWRQVVLGTTLLLFVFPLLPALLGVVAPAVGYLPEIGLSQLSIDGFVQALMWPGALKAIGRGLFVGIASTALSVMLAALIIERYRFTPQWQRVTRWLTPILALPHTALAIGMVMLLAPTGLLARLIAPLPLPLLTQDGLNLGLILTLVLKELPFVLLMSLTILARMNLASYAAIGASLGYRHQQVWRLLLLPQWLRAMRYPIFAVIAFSVTNVEVAFIIGSQRPPTFAVMVWQWFNDPDLATFSRAAAGAVLLCINAAIALMVWIGVEKGLVQLINHRAIGGKRRHLPIAPVGLRYILLAPLLVLIPLLIWTLAQRWPFPQVWPETTSLRFWSQELPYLLPVLLTSLKIAIFATVFALVAISLLFEMGKSLSMWLICLPLVAPQLSLLFGMQVIAYQVAPQWHFTWVVWAHIVFIFPYVYLSLRPHWESLDPRLAQTGASLGLSPLRVWWKIKFPLLLPALIVAFGLGISVSLALYLPTQMLGAGRINTITTEAVALVGGSDRRVSAIYALLQGLLPLLVFFLALQGQKAVSRRHQPKEAIA